ncbi:MAG: biotin--[acetyl-CoA-carboxylase] ligase [Candidatus Omnitrophica bacterium]|nr:biotin--[acetyl-CoA-carboxylase] ligase [Candidatus Omnitrophota bacterium]MBI5143727.1 biotin--[acetyl-CoA-carboxylase] ligase [Candidatus Omnitrophota bacterium]
MLDEKILNILRNRPDDYVSGEELCKLADISRAAIWKHIEKLRDEGYKIEAAPHLGYRLVGTPDSLIPGEIRWRLNTKILGKEVITYKKIDSTNSLAYSLAEKGVKEGVVILAEEQTKGRGRLGRQWSSPPKTGIYLSCILRPKIVPSGIPKITLLAAVAVAKSVRELSGLWAVIKWPNDILINGKKVCGILTEMKAEQDTVNFVILGIGVNVNTPLKVIPKGASSIKEEMARSGSLADISRIELTRRILENLEEYYILLKNRGFGPIMDIWKSFSAMLGSRIKVILQNKTFEGLAQDIDDDGSLIVRRDSGILEKVSSGDIVMIR